MSLKLDKEFYITLKGQCLPINWISSSRNVRIAGVGEIFISGFARLNEQHKPIHVVTPRRAANIGGLEIIRRDRAENIFLTEERTAGTQERTITASTGDEGTFGDIRYIEGAGEGEIIFGGATAVKCDGLAGSPFLIGGPTSATTFKLVMDLNIVDIGFFDFGNWEHKMRVDKFDYAQLFKFEFQDFQNEGAITDSPFKIKDSRFLSFNNLVNGVDFTNEQIPGSPTFCNQNLSPPLKATDFFGNPSFKNKLIVNDSSISKEIQTPIDKHSVVGIDHGVVISDGVLLECSASDSLDFDFKEYWLLEPATTFLLDAFNSDTPNDDLFDNPTIMQNMIEAAPGLDATIYGILRVLNPRPFTYNYSVTAEIFGVADDAIIRLALTFGPDLDLSTNTIQFSKGKKLFAGNGGLNLLGF